MTKWKISFSVFVEPTVQATKRVLNKDINFVFAHIMFYEKMKTIILRCWVFNLLHHGQIYLCILHLFT